jgi:hypothetical protein
MMNVCRVHRIRYLTESGDCPVCERENRDSSGGD